MSTPVLVEGHISLARLHGRACWHCGAVTRSLAPAGTVLRPGSTRRWQVVSCGCRPGLVPQQRTGGSRACTYCPQPEADCCVRVHPDSRQHIYAHQICAAVRGVWPPLYVFVEDGNR